MSQGHQHEVRGAVAAVTDNRVADWLEPNARPLLLPPGRNDAQPHPGLDSRHRASVQSTKQTVAMRAVRACSIRSARTSASPSGSSRASRCRRRRSCSSSPSASPDTPAVFGLLQSATMRPPPGVPDDASLVVLRGMVRQKDQPSWSPMRFSYPELREMSALRTIFSVVTAWTESDVVVDAPGSLDHAATRVQFVTDGYFSHRWAASSTRFRDCRRRSRARPPNRSSSA